MRIARLELFGFKSFPDRTTFEFGQGVSCVVGPNGSGKSNVVDAMRWCIGEMSARSLRGGEMLDVIFAGSSERAPVGFAEVRMTLSAESGEPFSGEYAQMAEVQVSRRLHRNGTSEYGINGVKCRRRDILELFLDTGVGNNMYSFIAQGQVDRMVHASAQDRRGIIDEAAGISRYAARRAEAQQRLEATAAQLDRAADVADERGRRLKVLERQVVRAARFRRLRALVRQEELALGLVRYRELASDRRALRERLRAEQGRQAANRRELARRNTDLTARREELAVVNAAASKWRDEVAEADARGRELQSQRSLQEQRAREHAQQADRAESEAEETRGLEAVERALVTEAEAEVADLSVETALDVQVAAAKQAWSEASERRMQASSEVRTAEAAMADHATAVAEVRARHQSMRDRAEALEGQDRECVAAAEVLSEQHEAAAAKAADALRLTTEAQARVQAARTQLESGEAELRQAEETQSKAVAALDAAQARLDSTRVDAEAFVEQSAADAEAKRRSAEEARAAGRAEDEVHAADRREAHRAALQGHREAWEREERELQGDQQAEQEQARVQLDQQQRALERQHRQQLAAIEDRLAELRRLDVEAAAIDEATARDRAELERLNDARPPGLPDARSVAESLALGSDDAQALSLLAGDRMWLPLVDAQALPTILAHLKEGDRAEVVLSAGDPSEGWKATWTRFEDAQAAIEHHLSTGGGAVAPRLRIDPDGRVHLVGENTALPGLGRLERRQELQASLERHLRAAEAVAEQWERQHAAVLSDTGLSDTGEVRSHWNARFAEQLDAVRSEGEDRRRELERQHEQARVDLENRHRDGLEALHEQHAMAVTAWEDAAAERATERDRAVAHANAAVAEARDRARSEVQVRIDAGIAEVVQCRQVRDGQATEVSTARDVVAAGRLALSETQGHWHASRDAHTIADAEVARIDAGLRGNRETQQRIRDERDAMGTGLAAAEAERARLDASVPDLQEAIRSAVDRRERCEAEERECAAQHARLAGQASARTERREAATRRRDEAKARAQRLEERIARTVEHAADMRRVAAEAAGAAAAAAEERTEVDAARAASWDRLQRERERSAKLREGLEVAEADGAKLQQESLELQQRVATLEGEVQQVRVDLEVLRRRMDERYQVALSGLLDRVYTGAIVLEADPEVAKGLEVAGRQIEGVEPLTIRKADLEDPDFVQPLVDRNAVNREALSRLGEVNLGALDEYRDLVERHADLERQREDLSASVADIRRAIAKMNRTCRQRFRDAFDRVNENFQTMYPRLVGGGSARLSLTDEEDLLQTGVEIFVQPPGKRLQSMTLLSGGEKAMTAIALLIALFQVKPSPFCVLDEVDAPLDEANGARFNEIIKEMSSVSQFVVITHNRKTMEVADTLYGVTMARPGVSRLVSVNLGGTG